LTVPDDAAYTKSAQLRAARCAAVFTALYVAGALLFLPAMLARLPVLGVVVAAYVAVAIATTWVASDRARRTPDSWVLVPIVGTSFLVVAPVLWSCAAGLDAWLISGGR